ncbi:MAG: zinc ribbon domain-containing protein [Planctomycetota bacterium]
MPCYDYACECGSRQEEMHAWQEEPTIRCTRCGREMWKLPPVPAIRTDSTFMAGRGDGFGAKEHYARSLAVAQAKSRGETPKGFYCKQLGRWVEDRDHLKTVLRESGHGCEELGIKPQFPEVPFHERPYRVADHLVEREIERIEDVERDGNPFSVEQRAEKKAELTEVMSGNG